MKACCLCTRSVSRATCHNILHAQCCIMPQNILRPYSHTYPFLNVCSVLLCHLTVLSQVEIYWRMLWSSRWLFRTYLLYTNIINNEGAVEKMPASCLISNYNQVSYRLHSRRKIRRLRETILSQRTFLCLFVFICLQLSFCSLPIPKGWIISAL